MAVALKPLTDKTAVTLLRALLDAIEDFGRPAAIRSDNESMFHSCLFRFSLAVLGVSQQFTRLHHPWENGRAERLFGTLKQALNHVVVANFAALGGALAEFRFFYNQVRPHQPAMTRRVAGRGNARRGRRKNCDSPRPPTRVREGLIKF